MKRTFTVVAIALMLIAVCGFNTCSIAPEVAARDGIAAAKGYIDAEQEKHFAECTADPSRDVCVQINMAIAAQNLSIDALEVYCASADFNDNKGPCVANKSLEPKLQEALRNLQNIVERIQTLTGDKAPKATAKLMKAGLDMPLTSFLGLLQLALSILSSLLVGLAGNPKYGSIVGNIQNAIAELSKAHDEAVTKEELESLRTQPKW